MSIYVGKFRGDGDYFRDRNRIGRKYPSCEYGKMKEFARWGLWEEVSEMEEWLRGAFLKSEEAMRMIREVVSHREVEYRPEYQTDGMANIWSK